MSFIPFHFFRAASLTKSEVVEWSASFFGRLSLEFLSFFLLIGFADEKSLLDNVVAKTSLASCMRARSALWVEMISSRRIEFIDKSFS